MIRDVCIHVANEQPLVADLYALPSASDAGLLCTNVRSLDGKRPVFIDSMSATFFFPYHIVRFLEIPEGALEHGLPGAEEAGTARPAEPGRPVAAVSANRLPALAEPGPDGRNGGMSEPELELDEDFLRRIRDI